MRDCINDLFVDFQNHAADLLLRTDPTCVHWLSLCLLLWLAMLFMHPQQAIHETQL